jgi:hypothetical protein
MKLDEFKAWFEGFTEDMDGAPTTKQWKRIKERVAEIDGVAISYPVYVERYWPSTRPWYTYPSWGTTSAGCVRVPLQLSAMQGQLYGVTAGAAQHQNALSNSLQGQFDGVSAMYAAGKAEALAA